ncbi:YbaK/EbsC family protein [Angustibacter sp. McL0619]|uniref:YbaK/EbsC family protein n=1 Tax=Angustibacter sp. McL0619 TaxID=3415676 RepID=UPI003CE8BA0C
MADLTEHNAVARVTQTLAGLGVQGQVRVLDDAARTAQAAADALGVEVSQIANSLVFVSVPAVADPDQGRHELGVPGEPLLIMTSGGHRVDTHKVADLIGVADLQRATPEIVRAATGFAIGGVAPVGHLTPVRTFIDIALSRYDVVWAAAGHPHTVFPTSYEELVRITGGQPIEVG